MPWPPLSRFHPMGSKTSRGKVLTSGLGHHGPPNSSQSCTPYIQQRQTIPAGARGAQATLQQMALLARAGLRDQAVRNKAVALTTRGFLSGTGLKQKDFLGEAQRIHAFVRDQIRYVRDTDGVELLHDAPTLLKIGAGDCDDKAILLASLLGSIGHPTRFVAVAFAPDQFSHVWLQDYINGRWVDLEATEPIPFGRSVPTGGAVAFLEQIV